MTASRRHRIPVTALPHDDTPRDECGVLGVSTPHGEGVAQLAFFGLTDEQVARIIDGVLCWSQQL